MEPLSSTYAGLCNRTKRMNRTLINPADPVPIAIIGGTGLGALPSPPFKPIALIPPLQTPWALPSSPISILYYTPPEGSRAKPTTVAFLARHGLHHSIAPHEINNRANVAALKKVGVKCVVGFSAVGSLREEVKPRDFCVAGGVIDWTKGVSESFHSKTQRHHGTRWKS